MFLVLVEEGWARRVKVVRVEVSWMRSSNKSRILTNEQKFINNNWTKHTNCLKKLTEFKLKLQKLANLVSFLSRFLCSD